jgi:cytochrome b subunit of formate dehydrogenase
MQTFSAFNSVARVLFVFFIALFSGFRVCMPWLFRWFAPIFGGGPLSREMHPWFGLAFAFSLACNR